jgi:exopolysaccharide biosynthesis polyprenyl glycosylphosphotransferase
MDYRFLKGFLRLFDIAVMMICFIVTVVVLSPNIEWLTVADFLEVELRADTVVLFVLMSLVWSALMGAFDVYKFLNPSHLRRSIFALLKADILASAFLILLALIFNIKFVNGPFLLVFCSAVFVLGAVARVLASYFLKWRLNWSNNRKDYLLVGMNPRAVNFAQSISSSSRRSHHLLGYVDVGGAGHPAGDAGANLDCLTDLDRLPEFLGNNKVDEVVLCLPLKSYYDEASQVISLCEEQGIVVRILADFFQTRMTHSRVEQFAGMSVITVASHNMKGSRALLKRFIDVSVATVAIVALAPLMVITAVAVALTSPGPVLFSQERVGLNKKRFPMIKFRTMVADAEIRQGVLEAANEAEGPVFKIRNDPRITSVGKTLRKFSIDELPQLFNVITGDMSLVGPRPLPLRDYAGFQEDWHRRRLSVRPGLTGLWQVTDRDHSSFERWMKLDIQYIDQWSLKLDIMILIKTIPAVLKGSGD